MMLQTYEAVLQPNGSIQFLEAPAPHAATPCRVLVTFRDEQVLPDSALCGASLSAAALGADWMREEEDAAWAHLQDNR